MKIGILGAGAIGSYLGGRLACRGEDVVFVGRLGSEVAEHGLSLSDLTGWKSSLSPERVVYHAAPDALADRDVILVTVKSLHTESAAEPLAAILTKPTLLVSFQNGVGNASALARMLPGHRVLAGMVPFNVLRKPRAHFHLATSGALAIERAAGAEDAVAQALRRAGFEVHVHGDMEGVLWSKLLFNLNNSINALAGVPLRDELSDRRYRLVLARSIREGLRCLKAAAIRPVRFGPMDPRFAPLVLSLPDGLFRLVAGAMLRIDPEARSSMWEDLERGRATEIEYLNGEILRLAERSGLGAPVNRRIRDLVKEAEAAKQGSPRISAENLLSTVAEKVTSSAGGS
jgi:2-dehydropantoate 2-reductase